MSDHLPADPTHRSPDAATGGGASSAPDAESNVEGTDAAAASPTGPPWDEASRTISAQEGGGPEGGDGGSSIPGPSWSEWMRQLPSRESIVVSGSRPKGGAGAAEAEAGDASQVASIMAPDVPSTAGAPAPPRRGGDFMLGGTSVAGVGAAPSPPAPPAASPGREQEDVDTDARTLRRRAARAGSAEARGPHGADFELRELIGQGGQGEVWRAWQTSLCREVAVKRLKSGDLTEFLQEAFTSAELDHPNIVPVHDLGRVGDGDRDVPLLAMKMVRGTPWNILIARDRLPSVFTLDRMLTRHLRILIDVCNAVAYAHSKGIIHRDLKPHQVMVGSFGEVFLMDWGLAVCITDRAPAVVHEGIPKFRTLHTSTNQCGSPAYMAPEQTDDTTGRLGFHTDVYLLGAILFELIAGQPPHASSTAQAAYLMAVTNEQNTLPDDTPIELSGLLERSLATDPAERPASVEEFRDALEDYLTGAGRRRESRQLAEEAARELARVEGEPALAYAPIVRLQEQATRALHLWPQNRAAQELSERLTTLHAERALAAHDLQLARSLVEGLPPSNAQRAGLRERVERMLARATTLRRQRRLFLATSFVLGAVLIALVAVFKVREARAEAVTTRLEAETLRSEERAREQRERADILSSVNALRQGEDALAEELARLIPLPETIDASTADLDTTRAAGLPALMARRQELERERVRLLRADVPLEDEPVALLVGDANLRLQSAQDTTSSLEAFALYESAHRRRPEHPDPLTGMGIAAARAGFATSASLYLEEATSRTLASRGERHPDYARALALEGDALRQIDESGKEYLAYYRKSLDVLEPRWVELTTTLAGRFRDVGRYPEALAMTSSALTAVTRLKGADSLEAATHMSHMARMNSLISEHRIALQLARHAVELYELNGAGDSPEATMAYQALAASSYNLGRIDDAVALHRRGIEMQVNRYGEDSLEAAEAMLALAHVLAAMRRNEEAGELYDRALAIRNARLGPDHPKVGIALRNKAANLDTQGRPAEATPLYTRALEIFARTTGERHPFIAETYYTLAKNLYDQNKSQEAEPYAKRCLELSLELYGPDHSMVALSHHNCGRIAEDLGRLAESNQHYVAALAIHRKMLGEDHPETATSYNNLGVNLSRLGRDAEAVPMLKRSVEVHKIAYGAYHPDVAVNLGNLAQAVRRLGRPLEAHAYYEESMRILRFSVGDSHPETLWAFHLMGRSLEGLGRFDEATAYRLAALEGRRRVLGETNYETVDSYRTVAEVFGRMGRHADSEQVFLRAWRLYAQIYGADSPNAAQELDDLARCIAAQGRSDDAAALDLALLDIRRAHPGRRNMEVADAYWHLPRDLQLVGDGSDADAFAVAAMTHAMTRDDATSAALVGRWDSYLRVVGGRRGMDAAARSALCLRIGAVVETMRRAAGTTSPWDLGLDPQRADWIESDAVLTSATLALEPPRQDIARRLTLRSAALARLIALPESDGRWTEFLGPRIAELGLADAVAALPPLPEGLTVHETNTIDAGAVYAYLDAAVGAIDFAAIDPLLTGDPAALIPPREQAERRLAEVEARLRERIVPALPPLKDPEGDARVEALLAEMLAAHPLHLEPVPEFLPRLLEGYDRYQQGNYVLAAEAFDRALAAADADIATGGEAEAAARAQLVPICYSGASSHARAGNVDRAFAMLGRAIEAGFDDADQLRRDKDLEPLRADTERFAALMERLAATDDTDGGDTH